MTTVQAAAIYARISSDDGTALGVGRQVQDCETLAARNGWPVAETFVDNDVSASNGRRRPQYEHLLAAVRRGDVDALVVWDVDRLTRTPSELEDFILLADTHSLALASVGGEVDLGTPQGRLTARIKGSVARHEVEQQSRRLRRKFLERAQAGRSHGKVAYGWKRTPILDVEGHIAGSRDVLNDEQAGVVVDAARRILARESVRSIVADLNARGVPPPRGKGPWEGSILRQLLLRERNAGRCVYRGEVVGRGDWPAILDEGTHDRVVALLTDPSRRRSRGNDVTHLLSGIARCGRCGGGMRVNVGRVTNGKRQPPAYTCADCFRVRRKRDAVDEVVVAVVLGRLEMPDGPDLLAGDAEAMRRAELEVEQLSARLDRVADDYAEGGLTAEQLKRITAKITPKIAAARGRQRAAAPAPELAEVAGRGDVRAAWKAASVEVRRAIIEALMTVTILPAGAGGAFDPQSVQIDWKAGA